MQGIPSAPRISARVPLILLALCGAALLNPATVAAATGTGTGTGMIEVFVIGGGDDVRFFVDGKRVEPHARIAAWYSPRAFAQLPPGPHAVEVQYQLDADSPWNQIVTQEPVVVSPGSYVRLKADLRRSGGGAAPQRVAYFQVSVVKPGRPLAASAPAPTDTAVVAKSQSEAAASGVPGVVPAAAGVVALEASQPPQVAEPGSVTAAGATTAAGAATPAGTLTAAGAATPAGSAATDAPANITIRGTEVISDGRSESAAAPNPDVLAAGPLPNDAPAPQELAPQAEATAANPSPVLVSFLVQSEPSGATATLDGKVVGPTPAHVQLDPRTDHIVSVARQGCETVVQLITAEAWRTGRSPRVLLRLKCK